MSKMRYFNNKFSKIAKRCGRGAQLTSDICELKLRDLPKLRIFKRIMMKSNFKKSVMTSFQWRYRYNDTKIVTKQTSQDFSI